MRREQSTRHDESQSGTRRIEDALEKLQGTLEKMADTQEKAFGDRNSVAIPLAPRTRPAMESSLPKLLRYGEVQTKDPEHAMDKLLPLSRANSLSDSLETVTLLEQANKDIQSMDAVYQDVTMPLMLMKRGLIVAVDAAIATGRLILPAANASFVSNIVDQILLQSHVSSSSHITAKAKRKPKGRLHSGITRPSKNTSYLESWMGPFTIDNPSVRVDNGPVGAGGTEDSFCLVQHVKHDTPWGHLEATLVLRGHRTRSEVLSFRFCFRPVRELANVSIAITYISQKALSIASVISSVWFDSPLSNVQEFLGSFLFQLPKEATKRQRRPSRLSRTTQISGLLEHLGSFEIRPHRLWYGMRLVLYPTSSHSQIMKGVKRADVPYSVRSQPQEPYSFLLVSY